MKRKILIFGIMLLILSPIKAYAADQVSLECNKTTVKPGDEVTCDIKFNNAGKNDVTSVSGTVTLGDNLEFVSAEATNKFFAYGGEKNDKNIQWSREDVISDESFVVGKVTFKVSSSAKSGTTTAEIANFMIGNDKIVIKNIPCNKATIKIDVPVVKGLKSLDISKGYIKDVTFSSSRDGYNVIIEDNTFGLSATANNSGDKIVVTDGKGNTISDISNIKFDPNDSGIMLLYITVGSDDTLFKYTLTVGKNVNDDDYHGYLSKLIIGGKTVDLVRGKTEYTIYLDNINNYEVNAYLEDEDNFKIEDGGIFEGNGSWVNIRIVPRDASSGAKSITYTINVLKKGSSSGNTTNSSKNNVKETPQTGDISMFFMAIILLSSLAGSLYLYKKNLTDFK